MTVNPNNNPLAYLGVRPTTPPQSKTATRAPTSADTHYDVGTLWTNTTTGSEYCLTQFVAGVPTWALLASSAGSVEQFTLTGSADTGGPVTPTAGNVNLAGGTGITLTGSGSTITFNVSGGGMKTVVSTTNATVAPNTAYINGNATASTDITWTLPTSGVAVGDIIRFTGLSTDNSSGTYYIVQANTGATFHDGSTSGASGGTITMNQRYGSVTIQALAVTTGAVTDWAVISATGTPIIA